MKQISSIISLLMVFLTSCDIMSNDEAIKYFEDQLSKDSSELIDLTKDSYQLALDSVNYTFRKAPRKKSVLVFEKGYGLFLNNLQLNNSDYRNHLFKKLDLTNSDGYSYIGKAYVEFYYHQRNRNLNYYRLVYAKDYAATLHRFKSKGYIIYENERPSACCNWFYPLDPSKKWILISP